MVWALLLVPLGMSGVIWLLPRGAAKAGALVGSLATLAVWVAMLVAGGLPSLDWPWIGDWGINFHLGVDGLSLFLLGLTTVLTAAAILASPSRRGRAYFFWILFLEFASIGLFLALNLFVFYIFWEAVLVPIFFLLTTEPGPRGRAAALKWLIMNLVGSLFMLVGIVAAAVYHAEATGTYSFEIGVLAHTTWPLGAVGWMMAAFLIAFAIKAPLWPLHGWMPEAYGEAPAPVTALLAGVLSKAGVYGLLRVFLPLFGPAIAPIRTLLLTWAVVDLVYGALMALRQRDVKMVAAYASMSHLGMIALGIFSLTQAGILGATFQMVAHGVMMGGLFVILGWLEENLGTRDLTQLGGYNRHLPRLSAYFLFFALAVLGLPGLPGFVGEYLILQGLVTNAVGFAVVAVIVLVVAAWYMLRLFQGAMQGPPKPPPTGSDLRSWQLAFALPMALLVLLLGVWPAAITSRAAPTLYQAVGLVAGRGGVH